MEKLEFKKTERRPTMSISIDKKLREDVILAAKHEGVSISRFIEQIILFVMSEKKKGKQ